MNRKFVRGLVVNTPGSIATPYLLTLMYNLWGYVIYGSTSPTAPSASAFPTTNPNNFPAGSLEGGTVLVASGTNGSTTNGTNVFTSAGASFTSAMIGDILVAWVPGSGSTDDGIYLITGVPSATQLQVQIANGGHPDPVTQQPVFNTRSSILYRVVNIAATNTFSWATTDYMIFQMNPTASDNPNASQATSQVEFIMNGVGGTEGVNIIGSPGGTWSGSAFTDAMSGVTTVSFYGGFGNWTPTCFNMTGDLDGMFVWFKGSGSSGASYIYFEAPTRVGTYPTTTSDQNPLVISVDAVCTLYTSTTGSGFNQFNMAGSDGVTRRHRMQVKSVTGDGGAQNVSAQFNTIISSSGINDVRLAYAFDRGGTFVSQILLGQISVTSVNFTRCRALLKQAASCSGIVPNFHRLGSNGQYLHIQNGVCQVWDNTIMPISLAPFGY